MTILRRTQRNLGIKDEKIIFFFFFFLNQIKNLTTVLLKTQVFKNINFKMQIFVFYFFRFFFFSFFLMCTSSNICIHLEFLKIAVSLLTVYFGCRKVSGFKISTAALFQIACEKNAYFGVCLFVFFVFLGLHVCHA